MQESKRKPINNWFLTLAILLCLFAISNPLAIVGQYQQIAILESISGETASHARMALGAQVILSVFLVPLAVASALLLFLGNRWGPPGSVVFLGIAGISSLIFGALYGSVGPIFAGLLYLAIGSVIVFWILQKKPA